MSRSRSSVVPERTRPERGSGPSIVGGRSGRSGRSRRPCPRRGVSGTSAGPARSVGSPSVASPSPGRLAGSPSPGHRRGSPPCRVAVVRPAVVRPAVVRPVVGPWSSVLCRPAPGRPAPRRPARWSSGPSSPGPPDPPSPGSVACRWYSAASRRATSRSVSPAVVPSSRRAATSARSAPTGRQHPEPADRRGQRVDPIAHRQPRGRRQVAHRERRGPRRVRREDDPRVLLRTPAPAAPPTRDRGPPRSARSVGSAPPPAAPAPRAAPPGTRAGRGRRRDRGSTRRTGWPWARRATPPTAPPRPPATGRPDPRPDRACGSPSCATSRAPRRPRRRRTRPPPRAAHTPGPAPAPGGASRPAPGPRLGSGHGHTRAGRQRGPHRSAPPATGAPGQRPALLRAAGHPARPPGRSGHPGRCSHPER